MSKLLGQIKNFFERQTENFRVLFLTSVLNQSIRRLTSGAAEGTAGGASYVQLYLRALGATPQQLGYLNSLGRVANSIVALPLGWISDRFSLKKVVVFGFLLSVIVPAGFVLSSNWTQAIPATMINTILMSSIGMFTMLFFVASVRKTSDRATAMSMRTTLISIIGIAIPTISAIIISHFGGISVEGIRPLFFIETFSSIFVLIYATLKLKEVPFLQQKETKKRNVLQDYKEIAGISSVKKWTFFKGLRLFFSFSLAPFYSLFYVEIKGADELTIAAMGTIGVLGALIFLVPLGRIADKYGRKRVIYMTRPFSYISTAVIILAPSPEFLIFASFLGSLQTVGNLSEITMEHELLPVEKRGRFSGFNSFLWGLSGIPGPILTGYLWERINPAYLLLMPILADLPFLVVLLTIPDTLHTVYDRKSSTR